MHSYIVNYFIKNFGHLYSVKTGLEKVKTVDKETSCKKQVQFQ